MGKSIVHCAECGKAIREDDYAKGSASVIDHRNYCSACRAVSPSTKGALDLRKGSTSRMPPASTQTPRRGTPLASSRSRGPLIAVGILSAIALFVLIAFALSRKGGTGAVDPLTTRNEPPMSVRQASAKTRDASQGKGSPVEPPAVNPNPRELEQQKREPAAVVPADLAAKPAPVEKLPPPMPRLTDPLDGSSFDASAAIPIEAEARDPQGRIARIEFWQGSTKLGESSDVPYRLTWKGTRTAGTYELKAKSIDREGGESASEAVRVTIKPEVEQAKALPAPEKATPLTEEPAKDRAAPAENRLEPKKEILPQVDQKKVDLSIKKAVQYLVGRIGKMPPMFDQEPSRTCHADELLLWTLIHANVSESNTVFRYLFKSVTEGEVRRTYEVALQAMILEELDRVRYQERIAQCAQFLVDNQCTNGQWGYGESPLKDMPTVYGALPVPTASRTSGGASGERQKPLVTRKLKVSSRRSGPAYGDNSNSQYAALGIRACADAGVIFPEEVLQRALRWFRNSQHAAEGVAASGVSTGTDASAPPAGWCYFSKDHGHGAYGSMTAGAIGGIAIYDTLLGEDWRKDPTVLSGLSWLARNFSVSGNPGPPSEEWAKGDPLWCHFYYLYALERAGVLCRTEWIGRHAWYPEGAKVLLAGQGRDGAWNESPTDTCFAILFLRRATRPLEDVASMDDRPRK